MFIKCILVLIISSSLVSLINGATNTSTKNDVLRSKLRAFFEIWRADKELAPGVRFPTLKHIMIKPFEGNYERAGVHMYYRINGMDLTGLDKFTIENIVVTDAENTLDGSVVLAIPEVDLYADDYLLDGRAYLFVPLSGKGALSIKLIDVKLIFFIRLVKSSTTAGLNADAFTFDFKIGGMESDLSEISWAISQSLGDGGIGLIENNHQEIVLAIQKSVIDLANSHLRSITKNDILRLLDEAVK